MIKYVNLQCQKSLNLNVGSGQQITDKLLNFTECHFSQMCDLLTFNHSELQFSINEDNITYLMYFMIVKYIIFIPVLSINVSYLPIHSNINNGIIMEQDFFQTILKLTSLFAKSALHAKFGYPKEHACVLKHNF